MAAQKPSQTHEDEDGPSVEEEELRNEDQAIEEDVHQIHDEDSDGSGTDPEEYDEMIDVMRSAVRSNVQCPICLGIIKKTRTVRGCLHRFCRECIDKSMRLGNNECPACRVHCSSRRSLRDDLDFDALIQAIYPDVDTYEDQELILLEEEKMKNKQIQVSIAEISRRQSEALIKRRKIDRDAGDSRVPRRNTNSRRRNHPRTEMAPTIANGRENELDGSIEPSASDLSQTQVRNMNPGDFDTQPPFVSPVANCTDETCASSSDPPREEVLSLLAAVQNPEMLTWGGGGARSNIRHGSGRRTRNTKKMRLAMLLDSLENDAKIDYMSELHFRVISLDKEMIPSLEEPYLCLPSSFSISQLSKYIAEETKSQAEDIDMLLVIEEKSGKPGCNLSHIVNAEPICNQVDWSSIRLSPLKGPETLSEIRSICLTPVLIIAYQHKQHRRFQPPSP